MNNFTAFSHGRAAAYNILALVNKPTKMDRRFDDGTVLSQVDGDIEFCSVMFSYPSRPEVVIFQDFSLFIPSGKTVALVGASGSGKSTVVSLIARFYDPIGGNVHKYH